MSMRNRSFSIIVLACCLILPCLAYAANNQSAGSTGIWIAGFLSLAGVVIAAILRMKPPGGVSDALCEERRDTMCEKMEGIERKLDLILVDTSEKGKISYHLEKITEQLAEANKHTREAKNG